MKYLLWIAGALAFVTLLSIIFRFPKSIYVSNPDQAVEKEIYVSSETITCDRGPNSRCLQVRFSPEDEWQTFYGEIEGFAHEIGTESKLLVRQEKIEGISSGDDLKLVWVKTLESKDLLQASLTIEGVNWDLVSLEGEGGDMIALVGSITALFQGGMLSGSSGCNTYTVGYQLGDDNSIQISEKIASTLKACADTVASQQESLFVKQLPLLRSYSVEEMGLTLLNESGESLMVFEKGVE